MGTEIKTWQIIDGKLRVLETSLETESRTEPYDLEPWVESNPDIIGPDIAIIGRQVMSRLERMIEWLSDRFNVSINAVVLNYVKTASGDELLARTSIISEEVEQERVKKQRKFQIPMSDDPGNYDVDTLRTLLSEYLSKGQVTSQRIKKALLPALLKRKTVTRQELKGELLSYDSSLDASRVGMYLASISTQLGMKKNDFLRQVVAYGYPAYEWEKDNFSLRDEYRDLVAVVLKDLDRKAA